MVYAITPKGSHSSVHKQSGFLTGTVRRLRGSSALTASSLIKLIHSQVTREQN